MHAFELVARTLAAVLLAAGFLALAYLTGLRFCARRSVLSRWVTTIAALLVIPTTLFHLLAALRLFALAPALAAILTTTTLAVRGSGGLARVRRAVTRDALFVRRTLTLLRRSPRQGMVIAFLVCAAPGLLRPLLLPPLGWDTMTYHAVKAGMWVQNGGVDSMDGTGPWGYYQNVLAGGEVFQAWAMLPLHSDELVAAVDVAQWILLGLVLVVLARRLSLREPFASVGAGFVLAVPTVHLMVGSGYVELGLLLAFATGLTLGLEAWSRHRGLGLAAGALGVAAATKLSMVPLATVLVLVLVGRACRKGYWRAAGAATLAFTLALAPWLIRTTLRTGLPFSPLPVTIDGVALGVVSPEVQWYMERPEIRAYDVPSELSALGRVFTLPGTPTEALGLLAVIPLLLWSLGIRRLATRHPPALLLIAIAVIATLAEYYDADFAMIRYYWSASSSRFLLPAVALLTLVSLLWCQRRSRASGIYLWVLYCATFVNMLAYSVTGFSTASFGGVCAMLAGAIALAAMAPGLRTRTGAFAFAVLVVAGFVGLHSLRWVLRDELILRDFVLHPVPKYWAEAVSLVDDPNTPRRIALTSGPHQNMDNWFASPFLGRCLQNELVYEPISADGAMRRFGPGAAELDRTASFDAWNRRLTHDHVTEVMSFIPASLELRWMEEHPERFERLSGTAGEWGLFRTKDGTRPRDRTMRKAPSRSGL